MYNRKEIKDGRKYSSKLMVIVINNASCKNKRYKNYAISILSLTGSVTWVDCWGTTHVACLREGWPDEAHPSPCFEFIIFLLLDLLT